jgi:PKD repeat protein
VTIYEPVVADFVGAPTSGLVPLTVAFNNTSTGDYTDSLWHFGDGVTSTLDSPTHTYSAVGSYTVTLTMDGPGGTDTETKPDYITVEPFNVYLPLVTRDV